MEKKYSHFCFSIIKNALKNAIHVIYVHLWKIYDCRRKFIFLSYLFYFNSIYFFFALVAINISKTFLSNALLFGTIVVYVDVCLLSFLFFLFYQAASIWHIRSKKNSSLKATNCSFEYFLFYFANVFIIFLSSNRMS